MNMSPSIFRSPISLSSSSSSSSSIYSTVDIEGHANILTRTHNSYMHETNCRTLHFSGQKHFLINFSLVWSIFCFGNAPNCWVIYMRRTATKLNIQINENKSTWRRHDNIFSLFSFLLLSHWQSVSIFLAIDSLPLWRFTIFFLFCSSIFVLRDVVRIE